jgi:hypothetical protein
MKRLDMAMLAIGIALLASGCHGATAPLASAPYDRVFSSCNPFEQSLLDRGALGLPEHVLVPQMGGLLAFKSDTLEAWH